MIKIILLAVFYILFPVMIITFCNRFSFLQKVGAIGVAYVFGLILSGTGIFPRGSDEYRFALKGKDSLPSKEIIELRSEGKITSGDEWVNQIRSVQNTIVSTSVVLAIPLLLFSLNLKKWMKIASKGMLSIILGLFAGVIMVTIGFLIWKRSFPQSAQLAGMFEGMYAGGSANFAAIGVALNIDPSIFVIANTYDILIGVILVLFFITIAHPIFKFVLPEYKDSGEEGLVMDEQEIKKETAGTDDFSGIGRKNLLPLLASLGISVLIVAVTVGLSILIGKIFPAFPQMALVILGITVLGILASLVKKINSIEMTFQLGMYLILIFSFTFASMADLRTILSIKMIPLILFIFWCYVGSLILHLILARVFRIDADNFLITSVALIFSPPFVPLVSRFLKNKDLIATGITGGLLGMMLGNFIGISLGLLLEHF